MFLPAESKLLDLRKGRPQPRITPKAECVREGCGACVNAPIASGAELSAFVANMCLNVSPHLSLQPLY